MARPPRRFAAAGGDADMPRLPALRALDRFAVQIPARFRSAGV